MSEQPWGRPVSDSQERPEEPALNEAKIEIPAAFPASAEPANAAEAAPAENGIAPEEVASAEPVQASGRSRRLAPSLAYAAGLVFALGIGWAGGHAVTAMTRPAASPAQAASAAIDWAGLASGMQSAQADTMRIAADLRALKGTAVSLKETTDRSKQEGASRFGQLAERLDAIQKSEHDLSTKLAAITERLDKGERDANARLAAAVERLERAERPAAQPVKGQAAPGPKALLQAALPQPTVPAPPPPAADPGLRTGSIPEQKAEGGKSEQPKTDATARPIEGWVLREVYDGIALIEGRNRRLVEIAPGQSLSGIGRVESIERRGRAWVVVTTRGVITSQPW
jgi:hypothetical protein